MKSMLIAALLLLAPAAPAVRAAYLITADSLRAHEMVLAHDSLEGRRVGEEGEMKAARYIESAFAAAGLQPRGTDGSWLQPFEFVRAIELGPGNRLVLNGAPLALHGEFEPMKQSASLAFDFDTIVDVGYGITVEEADGNYDDYAGKDVAGKAVLIKRYAPSADENPHVDFEPYSSLTSKINTALEHDAAGIFFITPEDQDDTLQPIGPVRITPKDIPIIFLRRAGFEHLGLSLSDPAVLSAEGAVELVKVHDTGYNVLGYLPGETDTTVIIGAHYDHLGSGGPGSGSRYLGNDPQIHNGADDNGSGTVGIMTIAKAIMETGIKPEKTIIIALWAAEENGLLGSRYFVSKLPRPVNNIRLNLNFDMISRYVSENEPNKAFMIYNDTFPAFKTMTERNLKEYGIDLDIEYQPSANPPGGSDHRSFVDAGIPIMRFKPGHREEYHTPYDEVSTVDWDIMKKIVRIGFANIWELANSEW